MSGNIPTSNPVPAGAGSPSLVDRLKGGVDGQGAQMSFMDHLLELRKRLWLSILTIMVCVMLSLWYYEGLFALIRRPVDKLNEYYAASYAQELLTNPHAVKVEIKLISTDPMDTLVLVLWMSVGAGLVFSSPMLIYQLWAFVKPGLRDKEKRALKPILYGGVFFFLIGCAAGYFVLFPFSIRFFSALNADLKVTSQWTMEKYSSLLLNMMAIAGLLCEAPLVVAALAKMGLLQPRHLTRYWRVCVLGAFILGAVFSPGTDVMSMLLFSGLLLSLYFVSIIMAHVFYTKTG